MVEAKGPPCVSQAQIEIARQTSSQRFDHQSSSNVRIISPSASNIIVEIRVARVITVYRQHYWGFFQLSESYLHPLDLPPFGTDTK